MYKVYKFLKKYLKMIYGLWASFLSATILGNMNNTWKDTIQSAIDLSNVANIVFLFWSGLLLILTVIYYISKNSIQKHHPNKLFMEVMDEKTIDLFKSDQLGQFEFSWGYNKNIHRCKNPQGWSPKSFWISNYDPIQYFSFPKKDKDGLTGYNSIAFDEFCESDRIKECRKNHNDMDRYAVRMIRPNYNDKDKRIQIELQKTKWSALQFHWNYMRLLDEQNHLIEKTDAVYEEYKKAFLNKSGETFLINSFCLHLILEDSKNNAILSRISSNKSNDYAETWAATIGEQLSLEDFYNEKDNSTYPDFIIRWTERALEEEFDISRFDETYTGENELETYVDMDSLRILSIDMEGDIYNIAVTAVIRLKITVEELRSLKGIGIDSEELTELKACELPMIRNILLEYPENMKEYHPSTYLRLLMFYLYKKGTTSTYADFVTGYKQKKKLK